jgi:hypothetical protein
VDGLVARAAAEPTATLRDAVVALKDRLVAEPRVREGAEQVGLEAILGAGLDTPAAAASGLEAKLRLVCGALMASPQFLLGGQAVQEALPVPRLTPPEDGLTPLCAALASRPLSEGLTVTCSGEGLTVN